MPFRGKWPRASASRQHNDKNFVRGHGGLRGHGRHSGGRGGCGERGGYNELTSTLSTSSTNIYSNALDALGRTVMSIVSVG